MPLGGTQIGGWEEALGMGLMGGLQGASENLVERKNIMEKQMSAKTAMALKEQENQLAMQRFAQEKNLEYGMGQQTIQAEHDRNVQAGQDIINHNVNEKDPIRKSINTQVGNLMQTTGRPFHETIQAVDYAERLKDQYRPKTLEDLITTHVNSGKMSLQQGIQYHDMLSKKTQHLATNTTELAIDHAQQLFPDDPDKQREYIKNSIDYFNNKNQKDLPHMTTAELHTQYEMFKSEMTRASEEDFATPEATVAMKKRQAGATDGLNKVMEEVAKRTKSLQSGASQDTTSGIPPTVPEGSVLIPDKMWKGKRVFRAPDGKVYPE